MREQLFQLVKREKGDRSLFGRKAETKKFFRNRDDEDSGEVHYTEHAPVQFSEPKKEKNEGYAIQKYTDVKRGVIFDRHRTQRTTHIKIQNHVLIEVLEPFLRQYDHDFTDGTVLIAAPFEVLFFARHEIQRKYVAAEQGSEEHEMLDHLINDVLQDDLWDLINESQELENGNLISWSLLWTLFERGSIVIAKETEGYEQAYQIIESDYKDVSGSPLFYDIKVQFIHFNGVQFGYEEKYLTIPYFSGKKCITELDAYPLRLAKQSEYLRKTLIDRGNKVLDYQDVQHVQIKPATVDETRINYDELMKDLGRGDVYGRAIVDFYTAMKRNSQWNKTLRPLEYRIDVKADPNDKGKRKESDGEERPKIVTTGIDGTMRRPNEAMQKANRELVAQDENNILLMYPLLYAFSLESRKWVTVNVETIGPVKFTDVAYEHLVADRSHKSLLLSLVESQKLESDIPEDPVPEKGKGLLVLLSGPPGTGKTLMAEAIAERARRPLYYVDARDLGANFANIAENFKVVMANACEWNAIVLLDEADIYLQQRSLAAPDGNERVTAFLRQLEYFQGILFMTTNLYDTLDKAVESRIHIHIPFDELSLRHRFKVWNNFLNFVPAARKQLNQVDVGELALWKINGRQIKNAFRMSLAICRQEKTILTPQLLRDMINLACPHAVEETSAAMETIEADASSGAESPPRQFSGSFVQHADGDDSPQHATESIHTTNPTETFTLPVAPPDEPLPKLPDSPMSHLSISLPMSSPQQRALSPEYSVQLETSRPSSSRAHDSPEPNGVLLAASSPVSASGRGSLQMERSASGSPLSPSTPKKVPPPVKKKPGSLLGSVG